VCKIKLVFIIGIIIFFSSSINAGRLGRIKEDIERTRKLLEEEKRQHQKEKDQSLQAIKSMEERIKTLESNIDRLEKEIISLNREIVDTKKEIKFLMERRDKIKNYFSSLKGVLLENSLWLKKNIDSGIPFYKEERVQKLDDFNERLEEMEIMDSLQEIYYYFKSEIDLSYNSELYSEEIETEKGEIKKAKFVRIGKIILFYRTNDGEEYGRWLNGKWKKDLCSHCRKNIKKAIEILEGRRIPELLKFPVCLKDE